LAALAVVAIAISGCSGATSTTNAPEAGTGPSEATTSTSAGKSAGGVPEASSADRSEAAEASKSSSCGGQVSAGSHTSCPFAEKVHAAFVDRDSSAGHPPATVNAYSPVTRREYALHCVLIARRTIAECTTGDAVVSFPLSAAASTETSETAPTQPSPEGAETDEEEESSQEGEDEVGSASHAGDTKFCSEHTCIGSFTTEPGTVVECSDGTFSHSGGIQGACSDHGGENR
jgi:hypothetical protein